MPTIKTKYNNASLSVGLDFVNVVLTVTAIHITKIVNNTILNIDKPINRFVFTLIIISLIKK